MGVSFNSKYIKFSASIPIGSYSAEYQIVYDAMTNKPSSEHAVAQDNFIISAVSHGYWTKLQVFHLYGQDSRTDGESLINWINPGTYDGSEVSGIAWTQYLGYTGDGTADCINMNYNPYSQGGKFTQNSASFGCYIRTTKAETKRVMGNGSNNTLTPTASDNLLYMRVNFGSNSLVANAESKGFYILNRSNSSTEAVWKNGSKIVENTSATSTALQNDSFYVVGHPTYYSFSTHQVVVAFVGEGLTDQNIIDFTADLEVLMDAMGAGII